MFGRIGVLELLLLPVIALGIVGIGMLISRNINRNKRPPPGPGQY